MIISITNTTGLLCDFFIELEEVVHERGYDSDGEMCDAEAVVVDTATGERWCEEHDPRKNLAQS
jgi:hypothetical protein